MLRQIAALVFIFFCTTVAWIILASTIVYRTQHSDQQLKGRIGSTWGTTQEQAPPVAGYVRTEMERHTSVEGGKPIARDEEEKRYGNVPIESSRLAGRAIREPMPTLRLGTRGGSALSAQQLRRLAEPRSGAVDVGAARRELDRFEL